MSDKKATPEELQQRTDCAVALLELMWAKWRIKDALQTQFGVDRQSAEADVNRARAKIREADDEPRTEKRSGLSAFYLKMMADETLSPRERLRAATQYQELHGLDVPQAEVEEVKDDIQVFIGDWRGEHSKLLSSGKLKSAKDRKLLSGGNGSGNGGGES